MVRKNFFVDWYADHGRKFPWRTKGTTPFAMLVTEMLLRQTRASEVEKLWKRFVKKYPDAATMAKANPRELRTLIKILGFGKMRSRALISAAKWLVQYHDGKVPDTFDALMKVPHFGAYSANAVLCFAFGRKVEIVDGNVLRFFSRYFGVKVKPDIRRNPKIVELASKSLPREREKALLHNYGLLDFTAEVCRSVGPRCCICPLVPTCHFGKRNTKEVSPLQLKRKA